MPRIWPPNNMRSWPVMSPMHGNDLNSKPWGVNYATGPKKYANRLVPWSLACVPLAPLPRPPARTILMLARASLVDAIGQDSRGYKTKCLAWGTLQTRQKTARATQTQHHPECQKETSIYASGEHRRVGSRVAFFRGVCTETLGYPHLSRET